MGWTIVGFCQKERSELWCGDRLKERGFITSRQTLPVKTSVHHFMAQIRIPGSMRRLFSFFRSSVMARTRVLCPVEASLSSYMSDFKSMNSSVVTREPISALTGKNL